MSAREAGEAGGERILVVDDSEAALALLVDTLTAEGYRPLVASSGESALERLRHGLPDLVLLDVRMPGMDGYETCRRMLGMEGMAAVPVVFMTALEEPEQKLAAFAAGAADYITKPFHPREVIARIRAHLRVRQLQRALERELEWRAETERALEASMEQALLVAEPGGRLLFASHKAARLLRDYFPESPAEQLPRPLAVLQAQTRGSGEWKRARGTLSARVFSAPGAEQVVLVCEEERNQPELGPLRALGLTEREAEVLYWIARGKTNAEIGIIVSAAAGTVKKHAENLHAKLGTETRAAAITLALEVLRRAGA